MLFCRECKAQVEECIHFVAPLDVPAIDVFDAKVKTLAYKKDDQVLEIAFKNGQVWQLFGVKPDIYDELLHATLSSFLKFLAHRYRASPVRHGTPAALIPQTELCPACKKPMKALHKTSGRTVRVLWQCGPCNQSAWKTYVHESVRERR
jgi:hypothetical protein